MKILNLILNIILKPLNLRVNLIKLPSYGQLARENRRMKRILQIQRELTINSISSNVTAIKSRRSA